MVIARLFSWTVFVLLGLGFLMTVLIGGRKLSVVVI